MFEANRARQLVCVATEPGGVQMRDEGEGGTSSETREGVWKRMTEGNVPSRRSTDVSEYNKPLTCVLLRTGARQGSGGSYESISCVLAALGTERLLETTTAEDK
jgi:hypothetical protein